MTKELQLRSVLDEAVRAYSLAQRRSDLQRTGLIGRKAAKKLADEFPESYLARGPARNIVFIGISAEEVLEDYLQKIGEKRGSKLWYRLASKVIARGEKDKTNSEEL
jgi:hypothetical protein